jgi:hypothetical protein
MPMLEIDSVVCATVLTNGGSLLLKCGEHDIFVDHTEIFWPPWPNNLQLSQKFPIGGSVEVFVKGYIYPLRRVLGSIKRVDPQANPYRKISRFEPGKIFRGRVTCLPSLDYLMVQLTDPYIDGQIGRRFVTQRKNQIISGIEMDVVIERLDLHQEILEFRFANDPD